MRKIFLLIILGVLLAACGGAVTPASTPTVMPSATSDANPMLLRQVELETQTGTAYTLAWSFDGETLAVASGGEITLLRDDLNEIQAVLEPDNGALGVTWNSDETQFATVNGFKNPTITIWDFDGDNQIAHIQDVQADTDQYGVAWSPNGAILATLAGDAQSVIQLWDTNTWVMTQEFELPYTKPRRALSWNADSSSLYGAGELTGQTAIFVMKVTDGTVEELGKFPVAQAEVFAVSPDASRIAISDPRGVVLIVDAVSGEIVGGFKSVDQSVDMAWNPNGMTLAILSYEGTLQLWQTQR
ncbi:MAG: WD40 repeat domain-containing protein [Anaerolineales bacterium]|nr:WD40 repeat domain-containing protein [Anaerolineales bacterium]